MFFDGVMVSVVEGRLWAGLLGMEGGLFGFARVAWIFLFLVLFPFGLHWRRSGCCVVYGREWEIRYPNVNCSLLTVSEDPYNTSNYITISYKSLPISFRNHHPHL